MNEKELIFLFKELKKIRFENIWLSKHIKEKNITVSIDMIYKTLEKDNLKELIIEYNETPTYNRVERRVLLRDDSLINVKYTKEDNTTFEKESNLCFVICLDNSKVITVYYNLAEDMHDTLIDKRYNANLKIIK